MNMSQTMSLSSASILTRLRCAVVAAACLALVALLVAVPNVCAYADDSASNPSVLVLDSGLGDYSLFSLHWLGEGAEVVAESDTHQLATSVSPSWWAEGGGSGAAPNTYVLSGKSIGVPTTASDIVWALDTIRSLGAQPKSFVVAMGTTGLPLREYVEDLAETKQSSRADIVGVAFCGTPHNGYSAMALYPELAIWNSLAGSAGISTADIAPQSAYLQQLNGATFPSIVKTLSISGGVGDLGFGDTDGAGIAADYALGTAISSQIQNAMVRTTVSQNADLTSQWMPFGSSLDYPDRTIDAQLAERLAAMTSYGTEPEVQGHVREFYEAWFSEGSPVTHNSSVLALDLSGSMKEEINDASGDKLTAAKAAAKEYLQAVESVSQLPQSAPQSVSAFGFNEELMRLASGFGQDARDAINNMDAAHETNIGIVLDAAFEELSAVPSCANRRILLLSDGATTRGQTNEEMLTGVVAQCKAAGIAIDAVGFGDVGESNADFLKQVAAATDGTYYQADDTYTLKVNFLKAYYSSLGLSLVDEELASGTSETEVLGAVDDRVSALEIGIVADGEAPGAVLLCNGEQLDETLYTVQQDNGLTSVRCLVPPAGDYSLQLSGSNTAMHVFAVKQLGIVDKVQVVAQQNDNSFMALLAVGIVAALAIVGVVARTLTKKR